MRKEEELLQQRLAALDETAAAWPATGSRRSARCRAEPMPDAAADAAAADPAPRDRRDPAPRPRRASTRALPLAPRRARRARGPRPGPRCAPRSRPPSRRAPTRSRPSPGPTRPPLAAADGPRPRPPRPSVPRPSARPPSTRRGARRPPSSTASASATRTRTARAATSSGGSARPSGCSARATRPTRDELVAALSDDDTVESLEKRSELVQRRLGAARPREPARDAASSRRSRSGTTSWPASSTTCARPGATCSRSIAQVDQEITETFDDRLPRRRDRSSSG